MTITVSTIDKFILILNKYYANQYVLVSSQLFKELMKHKFFNVESSYLEARGYYFVASEDLNNYDVIFFTIRHPLSKRSFPIEKIVEFDDTISEMIKFSDGKIAERHGKEHYVSIHYPFNSSNVVKTGVVILP